MQDNAKSTENAQRETTAITIAISGANRSREAFDNDGPMPQTHGTANSAQQTNCEHAIVAMTFVMDACASAAIAVSMPRLYVHIINVLWGEFDVRLHVMSQPVDIDIRATHVDVQPPSDGTNVLFVALFDAFVSSSTFS